MPVFICRWPNGDCSVVLARDEVSAIEKLDEVANAEGCPITKLSAAQVHFALADDGRLVLDGLGEETEREILEFCYPNLCANLATAEDVASVVRRERERVKNDQPVREAPTTELGRLANRRLDMAATLVNRIVSNSARQRLKSFKPRGNPS